jgi:hypothetical protein
VAPRSSLPATGSSGTDLARQSGWNTARCSSRSDVGSGGGGHA